MFEIAGSGPDGRGHAAAGPDLGGLERMVPGAELAALLETGEVDYILDYESVARQYGFSFVTLPDDLSDAILYGISVPRQAPHFSEAVEFVAYVLSEEGKNILREANVNVLNVPVAIGSGLPPELSQRVRTVAVAAATR
jgi:molybdate/tungstate transport system substrate-binding protein